MRMKLSMKLRPHIRVVWAVGGSDSRPGMTTGCRGMSSNWYTTPARSDGSIPWSGKPTSAPTASLVPANSRCSARTGENTSMAAKPPAPARRVRRIPSVR